MNVILVMAMTLDGKIGKDPNHFPDWTEKADKKLFMEISKRAGAVIMGAKTFDTIGRPLPNRKNIILTRNPDRTSTWENLIYTNKRPAEILEDLEKEGFREVVLAGGALVNSIFAEEDLIDEIIVTISPKIFGFGLSLFAEEVSMELQLEEVKRLGENLVYLKYRVVK